MNPSIHPDVFTCHEGGVLQIEYRVDDVRNFTHPSEGMKLGQRLMIIIGVLMTAGDTVLKRMLFAAYSSANALLTAGMVDFESTARRARTLRLGWSARTAEMLTTCPEFCFFICGITCCVMKK